MAAITQPQSQVSTASRKGEPGRLQMWGPRILIYIVLVVTAGIMLFPFIYMVTTSLKTATDVFRAPPRLLPFTTETALYNGQELPLYEVTLEDGSVVQMVNSGENIRYGFFTTPDLINADTPRNSTITVQVPLDSATETGETVTVGDDEFDVYSVPLEDGTTQELLLAFRGGLARMVNPNNPEVQTFANPLALPPVETIEFQWSNYEAVLTLRNLDRSLVNTTLVTFGVTFGQVVTSLLGGYAFSRMRFRGQTAVFLVYLGTIMIPFVVLIIPLYQIMVLIGWQDRLVALIVPWIFTAYGTFLMRQFFISIPKDLEEAATLDGLSRVGILFRVFVPLSGPAIATQSIITFLYAWNSFVWPLIIIGDSPIDNHVLTLSLITLRNAAASEPNIVLTGAAVAILPPLVLFVLAQRYFIEGIANTGLK